MKEIKEENFKLTIVGNGAYAKEILKLTNHFKNFKYYKFLKQNKLNSLYQKSDVLIFPSLFDGWGVVPIEAMLNNLFIIISKNCGVSEIIKNSKNIILPSVNKIELKRSINYCIKNTKQNTQSRISKLFISKKLFM